jgi:predicted alpha/beta superfamily hydrolase
MTQTTIRLHPGFHSRYLGNQRTLSVYLPPGYGHDPAQRYPVFYLHDGQNLFDPATSYIGVAWEADDTAERLIRAGRIRPVILVGIANTPQRLREYGPTRAKTGQNADLSRRYARFIVEEVKPFIDEYYATLPSREHTAVGGSSMGGLISLYLCRWYPEVFGAGAALSPSLWWDNARFIRELSKRSEWLQQVRLWLDMGTQEGGTPQSRRRGVARVRYVGERLAELGRHEGHDFRCVEVHGGYHTEDAWAARFDQVLGFLFGVG